MKIAEGNAYQKQSYEVQKDTNQQMKQLNETNGKQWDAIKEIKFVVKTMKKILKKSKARLKRDKNNTNITIALIGGGATVISAAFGLAKLLFKSAYIRRLFKGRLWKMKIDNGTLVRTILLMLGLTKF